MRSCEPKSKATARANSKLRSGVRRAHESKSREVDGCQHFCGEEIRQKKRKRT